MIEATSRGAVRERILFNRLKEVQIEMPNWETQLETSRKLKETSALIEKLESVTPDFEPLAAALLRKAFSGGL